MHSHCIRCDREVLVSYEHPRLRRWARAYFVLPLPFVPLFPIMATDFVVMLPGIMVYLLGIGPVLAVVRAPAMCSDCGAIVPAPQ